MKTKLIQTKDYLLLVDEKSKINLIDLVYDWFNNQIRKYEDIGTGRKIVAYYPLTLEAKELDLPLLPNPFKEVDFDNKSELKILLEKRAEESNTCDLNEYALGLLAGYKAAQSSNKQYSLEDVKKAYNYGLNRGSLGLNSDFNEYIQSLSTQQLPKEFVPECEKEIIGQVSGTVYVDKKLKTTINSQGKQELVGTYKY